jgi:hypothetical protein
MSSTGKKKNNGKLIVYIGRDEGYFQTLRQRFAKQFPQSEFQYHTIAPRKKEDYQKVFLLAVRYKPAIIYIDFSENRLSQLKLAQLLTRENALKNVPTVGLVETKANIRECISSGVDFTHIKSGEYHDVVFDPFFLAFPKETKLPNFARAKMNQQVDLINDFRIGYITKDGLHAEGNIPLVVGEKIKLCSSIPKNTIPSSYYIVKLVEQSNLYYDFRYAYELDFVFVDEPEVDDEADLLGETDASKREKAIADANRKSKQLEAQYHEEIKRSKKRHLAWLKDRMLDSYPKETKILLVDPGLKVFEEGPLLENYTYTIRTQSFLSEDLFELDRLRPHIIAFQFVQHDLLDKKDEDITTATEKVLHEKKNVQRGEEDVVDEEIEISLEEKEEREKIINDEKEKSRTELLRIVNKVQSIKDYRPFVIVFNSFDYTSQTLKDNFKYSLMLSNKGHINLQTVSELADIYQKRQEAIYCEKVEKKVQSLRKSDPTKYKNLKASDFDEDKVFVKKDDPLSYASFNYSVELETLTETELSLKMDKEVDHSAFRLDFPVPMTITLIPNQEKKFQKDGKLYQYKALIHSVDEIDKKMIRTAINQVFFDPLKKKRAQEQEAYQNVHDKALKEKAEKLKEEEKQKEEKLKQDQKLKEQEQEKEVSESSDKEAEKSKKEGEEESIIANADEKLSDIKKEESN